MKIIKILMKSYDIEQLEKEKTESQKKQEELEPIS